MGRFEILLRLLQLKFGEVPDAVRCRTEDADAQTLLQWSERVLTAGSFEQAIGEEGG
jgi:hypothetical protein